MSLHVDCAGTGPDLVLLHGWGMHSGAWAEEIPRLARKHRVHAIDLPGHGRSAAAHAGSFDAAADEIARLVPEDAVVCGWSLGGLLAQRIAHRHPRKVRRLVLVASTPCFVQRPDWSAAMTAGTLESFATGLEGDRAGTLARFVRLNALHGTGSRDAIRAFIARLDERGPPSPAALAASLDWLRETDLRAEAATISAPTLVVHGARDALAPVEAGRWLARTIPDSRLVEISDAAHLPFFTHREAFLAAMESFLG
jgi:pimeloyl-[acyl-carrier protein] methyl ester esterase